MAIGNQEFGCHCGLNMHMLQSNSQQPSQSRAWQFANYLIDKRHIMPHHKVYTHRPAHIDKPAEDLEQESQQLLYHMSCLPMHSSH
jgi:hypothetical protein